MNSIDNITVNMKNNNNFEGGAKSKKKNNITKKKSSKKPNQKESFDILDISDTNKNSSTNLSNNYIDIDDTICRTPRDKDYSHAEPIQEKIDKANKLYDEGNLVIYWTARGTVTGIDWSEVTEKQFKKWKVKHHEIRFGKPNWHLLIDDRVLNTKDW